MIVAILTGHAPVRKHLCVMDLFDGDPTCRFCRTVAETVQHMWFVPKVSVLIFYLNVYWTHLKLQVISFKV